MLIFNQMVFDGYVSGTADVFTDTTFSDLMASVETITVGGDVRGVTGASPTLNVQFQNSPDGARWFNQSTTPELTQTLSAVDNVVNPSTNVTTVPQMGAVRLRIFLGGGPSPPPAGRIRLWVVGRSPAF